jgi:hypothetical protein
MPVSTGTIQKHLGDQVARLCYLLEVSSNPHENPRKRLHAQKTIQQVARAIQQEMENILADMEAGDIILGPSITPHTQV